MKTRVIKPGIIIILIILLLSACTKKEQSGEIDEMRSIETYTFPLSIKKEVMHSLESSYKWLISRQFQDGSWRTNPAITALVLYSLVELPGYIPVANMESSIVKGFVYLREFVQEDGGIYQNEYRNYTTSVALLAFSTYGKEEDAGIISGAKKFLIRFQCDESEGLNEEDAFYGGIGYGGDDRPDLSNTQLALDAIKSAEQYEERYKNVITEDIESMEIEGKEKGLHWEKALVFLARCQNLAEVNNMPYRVDDDGGFMYETGTYKEDRSHSYGSMTYAGVKSLLYADIDKDDIRIQRALDWIREHYTLDENPGFGTTSIYYYYMTFSKCLSILGEHVIIEKNGKKHYWREDITKKLVSLQHEDGYWVNENGRYWENIKELAASYSIVGLKYAFRGLSEDTIS